MLASMKNGKLFKFLLYLVAIVLINIVGLTLFKRWDLTQNRLYAISEVSRQAVQNLAEPLTINAFFTKDLPAPHNATERYLRDLLEEYALHANKNFNYRIHTIRADDGTLNNTDQNDIELAESYGIEPIQIQRIDADEIKFQRAYMGVVLIHGDMVEKIPAITTTDGLEYRITTAISKLNNKIGAFANLDEKVNVDLYLSSSLLSVAPLMQLEGLGDLAKNIETVVDRLNRVNYNQLSFQKLDPSTDPQAAEQAAKERLLHLKWDAIAEQNLPEGSGSAGLIVRHKEKSVGLEVINAVQIPIIGTHYQLMPPENLEDAISQALEAVIDIHESIGLLASHGTLALAGPPNQRNQQPSSINSFRTLLSQNYTIQDVDLKAAAIPEGLRALIVARPTEPFSDWALYQIDQFLMQGGRLILFLDRYQEIMPGGQQAMMGGQPSYKPIDSGLERLLDHWGIQLDDGYVLDENCFKQQVPDTMGGGQRLLYFAPIIESDKITQSVPFMESIKGLVTLKVSPLTVNLEKEALKDLTATPLIASTNRAWLMQEPIDLNPMMLAPPPENEPRQSYPLAYLIEGQFPSYFDGKPIPVKMVEDETADNPAETATEENAQPQTPPQPTVTHDNQSGFIAKGKAAQIFIMGSADMITDGIIDEGGRSPNDMFVMNAIDALNNREEIAVMRSKQQLFNPLVETSRGVKTAVKAINIIGLPILVALFGIGVWARRHARQKKIAARFQPSAN